MDQNEFIVIILGAIASFFLGQIHAAGNIGNRPYSVWYNTHFLVEKKGVCKLIYYKPKHFERYTLFEVIFFFGSYISVLVFAIFGLLQYFDCITTKTADAIYLLIVGLNLSSILAIVLNNDIGSHRDQKKKFYLENGERETRPELSESILPKDNKYRAMAIQLWMDRRNNTYFTIYNLWDSYYIRLKTASNDGQKSNQVNIDYIEYFKNIDNLVVVKENKNGSLQLKILK